MYKMKTIKSRSGAIRVYKNVRSKRVILEGTEGALRQADLRSIGRTPEGYMQGFSWIGEGLHCKSYNRSPIPAGTAPWPLSRPLPFEVPWGEMEVVKCQEESTLSYMKTHVAAGDRPLNRGAYSGKFLLPSDLYFQLGNRHSVYIWTKMSVISIQLSNQNSANCLTRPEAS